MKYRFILGVGRSGTTLVARLMALSTSRMRLVVEPFPRVKDLPTNDYLEPWSVRPGPHDSKEIERARGVISRLSMSAAIIRESIRNETIERDDEAFDFLLIKEVHGLLAFPSIVSNLEFKAVVVTREVPRVLDSFLAGHQKALRKYLVDDFRFVRDYLKQRRFQQNPLLEAAVRGSGTRLINYVRRPKWLTEETLRLASVIALINTLLVNWAISESYHVQHVTFERLCLHPVEECERLYRFLDLEYDNAVLEQVLSITRKGNETGYYDTNKDSIRVLNQDFKCLSRRDISRLGHLLQR